MRTVTRRLLMLGLACCLTRSASGDARVFVDLNQYGLHPSQFTRVGDRLFFTSQVPETGFELWVKDGTTAPHLIRELSPGAGQSSVRFLRRAGNRVVFAASGAWGYVVGTDGTEAGTEQVIDPNPTRGVTWIAELVDHALICEDWHDGYTARADLYVSDGTRAGTRKIFSGIANIGPVPYVYRLSDNVVVFMVRMFEGYHLWRSDGTPEGTRLIGAFGSFADLSMTVQGGKGYFGAAAIGADYNSLYETDGTAVGTKVVMPYIENHWGPGDAIVLGDRIVMHLSTLDRGREMFAYEPATGQLTLLADLGPGEVSGIQMSGFWMTSKREGQFVKVGERVVFLAWSPAVGMEPFVTDGTPAGTHVLKDIAPGAAWSDPRSLTLQDGLVWFTANDGEHGDEIWVTDGTPTGTRLAADLRPGPESSFAANITDVDGDLYFSASTHDTGPTAWRRARGSEEFVELDSRQSASLSSGAGYFLRVGRWLVFRAPEPDGVSYSFWRSDGTAAGTERLLGPILYSNAFEDDDSEWIFAGPGHAITERWFTFRVWLDGEGWRYWLADVETGAVRRFGPEPTDTNKGMVTVDVLAVRNGRVYFKQTVPWGNTAFWSQSPQEATPGGFGGPVAGPDETVNLVLMDDRFTVWRTRVRMGGNVHRLWFGGPGGGGVILVWERFGFGAVDTELVDLGNGRFLFQGPDGSGGDYLWVTDGTAAGTRRIDAYRVPVTGVHPTMNGRVFTFADGTGALCTTDGTETGLQPVIGPADGVTPTRILGMSNGIVLFTARDAEHGEELWRTDGRRDGTFLLKDLTPGAGDTRFPPMLAPVEQGEVAYFLAAQGSTGMDVQLCRSDGSAEGTFMVPAPGSGPLGLDPKDIVVVESRVFFTGNSYAHGREPWVYETAGEPARLTNVSTRGLFPSVGAPMIAGVVLQGLGRADVLMRGVGPTLEHFGVTDCAERTSIRLMRGTSLVQEGRRIGELSDTTEIRRLETALGAFRLPDDGFDAVASEALTAGSWTMHAYAAANSAGTGLAELFVADGGPALVNISTRGNIDERNGSMIVGFVITGGQRCRILCRGIGPELTRFEVADPAEDPRIDVYDRRGILIASNDDWGQAWNSSEIAAACGLVSAFGLASGGRDASLMLELDPGLYTMHVKAARGSPGTALGEVYLLPDTP